MAEIWFEIGNKCLTHANTLLEKETVPTIEVIKAVRELVEIAIEIDWLNLQWVQKNQSGVAVFPAKPFSQRARGN